MLGAVRTKIAASLLGPSGMGLLAQAMSLRDLLSSAATFGSRTSYLKLVAEHYGRDERQALERLLVSALTLIMVLALVTAGAAAIASEQISEWAFGSPAFAVLVVVAALVVVVGAPARMVARTFTGVLDFRTYLQIAAVEAVVAVVAMAILAKLFGVAGAIGSFAVAEAAVLVTGGFLLWRRLARPLGLDLRPRMPAGDVVRRLARLASALTVTSLAASGAAVWVRAEVLHELGTDASGYYQVAWQVGQNYLSLLGGVLWSYGMPKVATRLEDPALILHLQNNFLRIVLTILAPGVIGLLALREVWIPILFSKAFLAAGTLVAWQLVGELVAMTRQSMNISVLPRERLGFLIGQAIFYWGLWALVATVSLPWLGATAPAVSYLVANLLTLGLTWWYHRTRFGYRLEAENRRLLAWCVPGVCVALALVHGEAGWTERGAAIVLASAWLLANRSLLLRLWAREA